MSVMDLLRLVLSQVALIQILDHLLLRRGLYRSPPAMASLGHYLGLLAARSTRSHLKLIKVALFCIFVQQGRGCWLIVVCGIALSILYHGRTTFLTIITGLLCRLLIRARLRGQVICNMATVLRLLLVASLDLGLRLTGCCAADATRALLMGRLCATCRAVVLVVEVGRKLT